MPTPRVAAEALAGWVDNYASGPIGETIPLGSFVALTERIACEAKDDGLGWCLGLHYQLRELGAIEGAVRAAPTLNAALTLLVHYFGLMQDASELAISRDDAAVTISYRILDPEIWPRHQDAIFTLGIIAQIARLAIGSAWDKVQMGVECSDAERVARLAQLAEVQCCGGTTDNWLRIPAALATLPMPRTHGAPTDWRALDRLLVQKRRSTTIDERVRALIYRQLGDRPISQDHIARCLGMSSRTLRRHLAASQTSFQDLVDDCRLRQAAHEFRVHRNVSIAQTALRLGYSEHSTFTRAFARWSGMPPQSFIRAYAAA